MNKINEQLKKLNPNKNHKNNEGCEVIIDESKEANEEITLESINFFSNMAFK